MTLFSLTPTFTQGLVLGQLSILLLLAFILRYLFFDTHPPLPLSSDDAQDAESDEEDEANAKDHLAPPPVPLPTRPGMRSDMKGSFSEDFDFDVERLESLEWFNMMLDGVVKAYRADLRGNLPGTAGNEAARRRIERWAQSALQSSILSPVKVHSVSLGKSAPRLTSARIRPNSDSSSTSIDIDFDYTDDVSMALSTSLMFNYPSSSFARLPISLSVSLSLFSGTLSIIPPTASSPQLTLRLNPSFTLSLTQSSLLGSRAKLSDVPKVHEMIEERIRRSVGEKLSEWRVRLPGVHPPTMSPSAGRKRRSWRGDDELHGGGDETPDGMVRKTVDVYVEK